MSLRQAGSTRNSSPSKRMASYRNKTIKKKPPPSISDPESRRLLEGYKKSVQNSPWASRFRVAEPLAPKSTFELHWEQGHKAFASEDWKAVAHEMTKALDFGQEMARVHFLRGEAHRHLGSMEDALADFGQSLAHDPMNPSAYFSRGVCHFTQRDYERALSEFEKVLKIDEPNFDVLLFLGKTSSQLNKFEDALIYFNRVKEIRKEDGSVYFSMGEVYERMGNVQKAKTYFKRTATVDPNFYQQFENQAIQGEADGDLGTAIQMYMNVMKLQEERIDLLLKCAHLYLGIADSEGSKSEAMNCYNRYLELNPNGNATAYLERADLYWKEFSDLDHAVSDYTRCFEVAEVAQDKDLQCTALTCRARIFLSRGNVELALADFEKIVQVQPNHGESHLQIATLIMQRLHAEWADEQERERIRKEEEARLEAERKLAEEKAKEEAAAAEAAAAAASAKPGAPRKGSAPAAKPSAKDAKAAQEPEEPPKPRYPTSQVIKDNLTTFQKCAKHYTLACAHQVDLTPHIHFVAYALLRKYLSQLPEVQPTDPVTEQVLETPPLLEGFIKTYIETLFESRPDVPFVKNAMEEWKQYIDELQVRKDKAMEERTARKKKEAKAKGKK